MLTVIMVHDDDDFRKRYVEIEVPCMGNPLFSLRRSGKDGDVVEAWKKNCYLWATPLFSQPTHSGAVAADQLDSISPKMSYIKTAPPKTWDLRYHL